jgi:hypothetical protein
MVQIEGTVDLAIEDEDDLDGGSDRLPDESCTYCGARIGLATIPPGYKNVTNPASPASQQNSKMR